MFFSTTHPFLVTRCCDRALTLAERHRCVPLVDPLRRPGARGAALANKPEALVAAEAQGAAQLRARQAVHRAVHGAVRRAAVGRYGKKKKTGKRKIYKYAYR